MGKLRKIRKSIFPTARSILLDRELKGFSFTDSKIVLVVGAGSDPYRSIFPNAKEYICSDIEKVGDHIDMVVDAHEMPFENNRFDAMSRQR